MSEDETFDVVIVDFDNRPEAPEARLQRAFGIEANAASLLVLGMPSTVQRGVSLVRAEYFRRALALIGAVVEVRDAVGTAVQPPPPSQPAPPAPVPPEAPLPSSPAFAPTSPAPAVPGFRSATTLREAALVPPAGATLPDLPVVQPEPAFAAAAPPPGEAANGAPLFPPIEWPPAAPAVQAAPPAPAPSADLGPEWGWWKGVPAAVGQPTPSPEIPSNPNLIAPGWGQLANPAGPPAWAVPRPAGKPASDRPPPAAPLLGARDPSDVWDPPPVAQPRAGRAPGPRPSPDPGSGRPPRAFGQNFGLVSVAPGSGETPLALAEAAPTPRRHAVPQYEGVPQALTFDGGPVDEAMPVLGAWEQPNASSMAEPASAPSTPLPPKARSAREAAARDDAASLRPPKRAGRQLADELPRVQQRPSERPAVERPPRPRPAAAAPASIGVAERPPPRAARTLADTRSFWETLGDAFTVPLRGPGLYWVFAIATLSVAVSVLSFFAGFVPLLGNIVIVFANTCVLAFACDYYRVCFWAPASGEEVIDRGPDFDPARLLNNYIKSGIHLMLFMLASQVLLIAFVAYHFVVDGFALETLADLATNPLLWLLVLFPYYYWTMGVALTALTSNFTAIWNVAPGLRAIARAPLEYTFIVAVGFLVLGVTSAGLLLFGSLLGATGALLSGSFGIPLALSHGIQGALMGHLMRARPEVFEE